jgi:hypothetical protein
MLLRAENTRRFDAVEEGIADLFRENPALCGFTVQGNAEIVIDCWPREVASPELCEEIAQKLVELVEGKPEAAAWLLRRTFARTLQ